MKHHFCRQSMQHQGNQNINQDEKEEWKIILKNRNHERHDMTRMLSIAYIIHI